jgi:FkbM family methyltransferase
MEQGSMIIDLEQEVQRYRLSLRHALHVGAHHGEEDALYRRLGIEPIYVEANPEAFAVLRQALPDRECHPVAIADREGIADFHVTSFDQSSSLLPLKKHLKIYPGIVERCLIQVPCTTIDALLGPRRNQIDLINMDIQGAELLALRGASQTLPHVKCLVTEVNRAELYEGCGLMHDLDNALRPFGFRRVRSSFPYHHSWGDAFYVHRRYLRQETWWGKVWGLFDHRARWRAA